MSQHIRRSLFVGIFLGIFSSCFLVNAQGVTLSPLQTGTVPFNFVSPTPTSAAPGSTITVSVDTSAQLPPDVGYFSIFDSDNPNFNNPQALLDSGVQRTVWRSGNTYSTTFQIGSASSYKVIFWAMTGQQQNVKVRTITTATNYFGTQTVSSPPASGPAATVTLSKTYTSVPNLFPSLPNQDGVKTTINWNTTNALYCTLGRPGVPAGLGYLCTSSQCGTGSKVLSTVPAYYGIASFTLRVTCYNGDLQPSYADVENYFPSQVPVTTTAAADTSLTATAGTPTISISVTPTTADAGGSVTLSWDAKNVGVFQGNSCYGRSVPVGLWSSGYKPVSGTEVIRNLPAKSTFTKPFFVLSCYNVNPVGTWLPEESAFVTMNDAPATPTCRTSSENQTVSCPTGQTGSITQTRTSTCPDPYGQPVWGGWVNTTNTCVTPTPTCRTSSEQQTISCPTGQNGTVTQTRTSTCPDSYGQPVWGSWVNTASTCTTPVATIDFSSSGNSLPYNSPATLYWSSGNATRCVASDDWSGNKSLSGQEDLPRLVQDKRFTISCYNAAGQETKKSITITVAPPPPVPTVSLTSRSNNLTYNTATVLNWSSTAADSCTGSWRTGPVATVSSFTTPPLTESSVFTITCSGVGGEARDSVNIAVGPAPVVQVAQPATVTLDASPSTLTQGQSTRLSWSSTNATTCTSSWGNNSAISGSETVSPSTTTTYRISCTGEGGRGEQAITVTVSAPQVVAETKPLPQVSLDSSQTTITEGQSSILTWSSTNTTACSAPWTDKTSTSDTQTVSPRANTTYTIECTGPGGKASQSAIITVNQAPAVTAVEIIRKVPPTLTFSSSENAVSYGGTATLSWRARNATECYSSGGDWVTVNRGLAGEQQVNSLTSDKSYLLTCTGDGGEITQSVGISVAPQVVPAETFSTAAVTTSGEAVSNTTSVATVAQEQTVAVPQILETVRQTITQQNVIPDRDPSVPLPITINAEQPVIVIQTIRSPRREVVSTNPPPQPKLRFSMQESKITPNKPITLVWKAENVSSCDASGDWDGVKNVAGTFTTQPITGSKNYVLSCTGDGGSISSFVEVNFSDSPPPTLSFVATPHIIQYGKPVSLLWETTNALWCKASGSWSGAQETSGSYAVDKVGGTQGFKLTCGGPGGEISREIRFDTKNYGVRAATALKDKALGAIASPVKSISSAVETVLTKDTNKNPAVTLNYSTKMVDGKRRVILSWTGENLKSCMASGAWSNGKNTTGSEDVGLYSSVTGKTYTLTCRGTYVVRDSVTVK